jgi:CRP/FNR family cyclic AMP-dependent transcriptional regulator
MKISGAMMYLLGQVRLFEAMSESERMGIARFMRERTYAKGETVCLRGQPGNTMYVILQGAFSVVIEAQPNQTLEVARLESGEVLGEMFCLDPAPRPATVVAACPTKVLEMDREDLARMRRESPHAAAALVSVVFREIVRRLRRVDDRVERELASEEEAFYSELWPEERARRLAQEDEDPPAPWKASFSRIRGCA